MPLNIFQAGDKISAGAVNANFDFVAQLAAQSRPSTLPEPLDLTSAGALVALTNEQAQARNIIVTGTLGQNTTIQFPAVALDWVLIDRTARNGKTLSVKPHPASPAITLFEGEALTVIGKNP